MALGILWNIADIYPTAVMTLHPLYSPDTFSFRSLTFASDDDYVDIGRSSKRETKNLVPAHYNAWFDSRVMSRDHARIGVNMAEKVHLSYFPP